METITRLLFIAAMACVVWLSYRLDTETTAHAATMVQVHRERDAAIAAMRKRETETAQQLEKINAETQSKLDTVQRNLDAANRAGVGLRQQLTAFAKRDNPAGASATQQCAASQSRVDLLAILLAELDDMAGEYARQADESRQRGFACELSYEAIR